MSMEITQAEMEETMILPPFSSVSISFDAVFDSRVLLRVTHHTRAWVSSTIRTKTSPEIFFRAFPGNFRPKCRARPFLQQRKCALRKRSGNS